MTDDDPRTQWRVEFDAEVGFGNGGGLQTRGFRLDIPGDGIEDAELAELFIAHLGLLMVDRVAITRKALLNEPHKGSRGVPVAEDPGSGRGRVVEVCDRETRCLTSARPTPFGLVDLPGVLVRTPGGASATVERPMLVPVDVRDRAVVLDTGGRAGLTEDAAAWLIAHRPALVAFDTVDAGPAGAALYAAGVPLVVAVRRPGLLPPHGFRLHVVRVSADAGDEPAGSRAPWRACVYAVLDAGSAAASAGSQQSAARARAAERA